MNLEQLLIFELGDRCNLSDMHPQCPNGNPKRWDHLDTSRPLYDETIVSIAEQMYRRHGFRGLIGFHHYNEPMLSQERMFRLMNRIRARVPEARFILWTNGTKLPRSLKPLRKFDRIVVTDYGNADPRIKELEAEHPGAVVYHWDLDSRLDITGPEQTGPCARPFVEFAIDCYGNVKLCCFDWQGIGSLGNVYTHGLDELIQKWKQIRRDICGERMTDDAPAVCRTCRKRHAAVLSMLGKEAWLPEIVEDAKKYVEQVRSGEEPAECCDQQCGQCDLEAEPEEVTVEIGPVAPKVAVVFVSYLKVPEQRLQDHFRWNDEIYRKAGARVYVVTDRQHDLPSYAECVIYPEDKLPMVNGKRRFSLCATKNAGIKAALACPTDVLICTDVDMMFPRPTWDRMVGAGPDEAVVPVYLMVPSAITTVSGHLDQGCTGTVAMTAENWAKIKWDERCVGYGADDGVLLRDIKAAGVKINRDCTVCHVEHPDGDNQKNSPGHGRAGCYGRDEFNWDNFEENRKVLRGTK